MKRRSVANQIVIYTGILNIQAVYETTTGKIKTQHSSKFLSS